MFTIKLYRESGARQRILAAESFTVLRDERGNAEITLHRKGETYNDVRYDIILDPTPDKLKSDYAGPEIFHKAIIENAAGKTTEIIAPHI